MVLREYNEAAHIANEKQISYDDGFDKGEESGKEKFALVLILKALTDGKEKSVVLKELTEDFGISEEKAEEYFSKCI